MGILILSTILTGTKRREVQFLLVKLCAVMCGYQLVLAHAFIFKKVKSELCYCNVIFGLYLALLRDAITEQTDKIPRKFSFEGYVTF